MNKRVMRNEKDFTFDLMETRQGPWPFLSLEITDLIDSFFSPPNELIVGYLCS